MNNKPTEGPALFGYIMAKALLATLMAFVITTYSPPMWVAALLIFIVS